MKRMVAALLSILVSSVWTSAPAAGQSGTAKGPQPVVVRDLEAGRHTLKAKPPQQQDTAVEPSITVNPENPLNVVVGFQAGRVDAGCAQTLGYATTFDGGKTWKTGVLPKLTIANGGTTPLASDPVVAFGPENTVYFNSLLCEDNGNDLGFSVSEDGGKTWSDPIVVPPERTFPNDDKNWIIVDNEDAPGHHLGRIYLVWDQIAPVVAMYSDDKAQTWHGPFVIYEGQGIGTWPLIMPNGDLAVIFNTLADPVPPLPPEPESTTEIDKHVISFAPGAGQVPTGGPLAFQPPITVSNDAGVDSRQQRAGEGLPQAGVDAKTGRIYVTWADARFSNKPVNDVVVTWSDNGVTWTPPMKINPGKPSSFMEHFTPALSVGEDGVVRVAYRRQRQSEDLAKFSPFVDTIYRESRDGGETWTRRLFVNKNVRTDVRFAAFSRNSAFLGDYHQMAVAGSWAYVVRCEAFRLRPGEPAIFPPKVHHQRAWVAVVDSDGNGRM